MRSIFHHSQKLETQVTRKNIRTIGIIYYKLQCYYTIAQRFFSFYKNHLYCISLIHI